MLVYYMYVVICILGSLIVPVVVRNKKNAMEKICFICFSLLFLLLALRHPSMGYDLRWNTSYGYLGWFEKIANMPWKDVLNLNIKFPYERGYVILNKIIGMITKNSQVLIGVSAFLSVWPVYKLVKDECTHPIMSMMIFLGLPGFLLNYSALRQGISMGICMLSLKYVKERDIKKFLLMVFVATTIHFSAFVFVLTYFVYNIKLNKVWRIVTYGVLLLLFTLRVTLFPKITFLFAMGHKVDMSAKGNSLYFWFFFFIYLVCTICLLTNRKDVDRETFNGYSNILYLGCCCCVFQDIYSISARVTSYFVLILVVLVPMFANTIRDKKIRFIYIACISVLFLYLGMSRIYEGSNSYAVSSPYYFYWQQIY